jgi:hypothetical protein
MIGSRCLPRYGRWWSLLLLFALSACGGPGQAPEPDAVGRMISSTRNQGQPAEPGPLRKKAMEHDRWIERWHTPDYGSHLHVQFTDDTRTRVDTYHGHGDSCIWTGTYAASQALRYRTTGDPQARANVIRSIRALTRHLDVTGRDGFIARYVGPADDPGHRNEVALCGVEENHHLVTEGEFAGDFWVGNTSRDQYTGWFLGMAWAYDTVDDPEMRAQIRSNVTRVLDRLIADNWWIIDVDGVRTTKAPNVLPPMQMTWALIGYHITGEERFFDVFDAWAASEKRIALVFNNISTINRYAQQYGLNLAHENFLSLLRLSHPYGETHRFLMKIFNEQTHRVVDLQHNPWYTAVFLAEGGLRCPVLRQKQKDQIIQDLTDFPAAPKIEYGMVPPEAELDPLSVSLYELQQQYPFLADIMGTVEPQAAEAYRVKYQCSSGFIFQRSMWAVSCDQTVDVPSFVNSGHDFLAAYWLASAYGVLQATD